MRDPFPIPPIPALSRAVQPFADRFHLPSLPLHIHEVFAAALLYTFIQLVVSPAVSTWLWPSYYPAKDRGRKISWDAHVVSIVQSTLINILALWVMFVDDERSEMDWEERVWGYDGASAMVQALAAGYFLWDLIVTVTHLDVFGLGLLAHASSALCVYSFGFRPFLNHYSCVFILYELSTPFLNIHWFFDKLGMTGTKAQLYNGILLLATFFSCRLIWGTYQSGWVYADMYRAWQNPPSWNATEAKLNLDATDAATEVKLFAANAVQLPTWLPVVYMLSNFTLQCLNVHWFGKMIKAVRKRFDPKKEEPVASGPDKMVANMPAGISTATEKIKDELKKRQVADTTADEELENTLL